MFGASVTGPMRGSRAQVRAQVRAQPRVNMAQFRGRAYSTQPMELPRKVRSLHEVMKLWDDFKANNPIHAPSYFHDQEVPYLYGYGFRGLKSTKHQLIPSIFRKSKNRVYEQSIYYGFRLIVTEPQKDHRSIFDWLTLMQHYDAPTRLLDWSESILKAMFFVVEDPPEAKDFKAKEPDDSTKEKIDDGVVWILNSYKLNRLTSILGTDTGVGVPETFNTVVRAEMTTSQDLRILLRRRNILDINTYDLPPETSLQAIVDRALKGMAPLESNPLLTHEEFLHRLQSPFATQSYRLNERIRLQSGFFTIFGGKVFNPEQELGDKHKWSLGKFKSLEELNDLQDSKNKFMVKFCVVPADCKKRIHNELFELGINKATVYGDIPNVAKHMNELLSRFELDNPPQSDK